MVRNFDDVVKEVSKILKQHPNVARADLFGSFARGDQDQNSDIDLVIFKKEKGTLGFEFFSIADEIENATGRNVDLISPLDVHELRKYGSDISKEVKCIYES